MSLVRAVSYGVGTAGAINLYITGVTIRANSVLDTRPPMMTHASGACNPLPWRAIGSRPPMAVRLVSTIGRKRTSPALRMAASSPAAPSVRSRPDRTLAARGAQAPEKTPERSVQRDSAPTAENAASTTRVPASVATRRAPLDDSRTFSRS